MTTTALFGSTGFVGGNILTTLLGLDKITAVHTVGRRAPAAESPKLINHVEADSAKWPATLNSIAPPPDVVFSAIGTTRAAAGGLANQWKIDHDLNVDLARAAHAGGIKTIVFISSTGIRGLLSDRVPYSQMKQGVEDTIKSLGFEQAIILRPGFILGDRNGAGHGTTFVHGLVNRLGFGLRDRYGQDADVIGRAAVHATILAREGKAPSKYWIIEQADVVRLGRDEFPKLQAQDKPAASA